MSVAIKHKGRILNVTSSSIEVKVEEDSDKCGGCAVSMFCGSRNNDKSSVVTFTDKNYDLSGYKIGDVVSLSFSGITQLRAAFLTMGIPCGLLALGVLMSLYAGLLQGVAVLIGLVLVGGYILTLYMFRKLIRSRFRWTLLGKLCDSN